jgi:hypothetical protein
VLPHTEHLCISVGSYRKQRLFPYTALTGWFLQPRRSVFTARYGLLLKLVSEFAAVTWLKRPVSGLSSQNAGTDPRSVHVRYLVGKMELGQVFSSSTSVFPCQPHSTNAPYSALYNILLLPDGQMGVSWEPSDAPS